MEGGTVSLQRAYWDEVRGYSESFFWAASRLVYLSEEENALGLFVIGSAELFPES